MFKLYLNLNNLSVLGSFSFFLKPILNRFIFPHFSWLVDLLIDLSMDYNWSVLDRVVDISFYLLFNRFLLFIVDKGDILFVNLFWIPISYALKQFELSIVLDF